MAILRSQDIERDGMMRRRAPDGATADDAGPTLHPLLTLQHQVGNAHIARMLAQREGAPEEEEEAVQAKHDLAQREGAPEEEEEAVQAKHDSALAQREGAPEEEAVQAKHDFAQREGAPEEEEEAVQAKHDFAQREGAPEEEEEAVQAKHDLAQREGAPEEEEETVQAKPEVGLEGGPVSADLSSRIQTARGGGSALDTGTQATMESGFGTSFKDVRVHTDGESDALNRSISAKAFTTGNDIFFRKDTSPTDHSLLAHELTHVVQQRSMGGSGGGMTVGPAGDSHEQQADSMASAVTSGAAAQRAQAEAAND